MVDSETVRAGFEAELLGVLPGLTRLAAVLIGPGEREDLVQETLTRAWAQRGFFDPARGQLSSWVMTIMANLVRSRWRVRRRGLVLMPERPVPGPEPGRVDVWQALRRLSARQRAVVVLFYFIDLPVAEVATVLGCSPGTVKSTLSDARARLEKELGVDD